MTEQDRHPFGLEKSLDHVLAHTGPLWTDLRGARLFLTGGTGFFGCWLLESLAWANDRLGLDMKATVLTRNPDAFHSKVPHLAAHPSIQLVKGDVQTFAFPREEHAFVIHAATETREPSHADDCLIRYDSNTQGTRRVLEFARAQGVQRLLFTSSGAVYGSQPSDMLHLPETHPCAPDTMDPQTEYGQAKRACEFLCAAYGNRYGIPAVIARCFAFVGPYLPLDANFAIGNFIRDARRGGPLRIMGDGTPLRSYLYAADLVIWLVTLLLKGQTLTPYNVGSMDAVSIRELAEKVRDLLCPGASVDIAMPPSPGTPPARYIPCTRRAQDEFGLRTLIDLQNSILYTSAYADVRPHD